MPRVKGDFRAALISIPGCLICWEPLQQRKTSTTSINSEKTFRRICSILNVDLSSSTWDFRIEAFPFCGTCTREIQQLIRLQDKLELIQKEIQDEIQTVRNKLVGSDQKFISADLRIIGFRSQVLGGQPIQLQHSVFSGNQIQPTSSGGFHNNLSLNYHPDQQYTTGIYDPTSNYSLGIVNQIPVSHQNYHSAFSNRIADQNNTGFGTNGAVGLVELEVQYDESNSTLNEYDNSNHNGPPSTQSNDEDYNISAAPSASKLKGHNKKVSNQKNSRNQAATNNVGRVSQPKSVRMVEEFAPLITSNDGRMFYENIEIMKNDQGTFYCGQCEYNKERANTSVTLTRMKTHINGVHLDRYKCSVCDKSYTSREHLIGHEKKQHQIGVVLTPCPICGMPITDFSNWMKVHMWKHKNAEEKAEARALGLEPAEITNYLRPRNMKYKCPHCNKGFYKQKDMERHSKKHLKPSAILAAAVTDSDFKTVYEDVEITKNETGFVCGKCGFSQNKGFKPVQFKGMQDHIKAAHYGAFVCELCERQCRSETSLKSHKLTHSKSKMMTCDICQKPILSGKYGMRNHKWLHKNDEEKEEARALGLAPKQTVRRTERKYICETCGRTFSNKRNWRRHNVTHLPPSEQPQLKCPKCDCVYRDKSGLLNHFKTKHDTRIITFTCPVYGCEMKFLDKRLYNRHVGAKHKKPNFTCMVCRKSFKVRSHLVLHSRSHPPITVKNPGPDDMKPVKRYEVSGRKRWSRHAMDDSTSESDIDSYNDDSESDSDDDKKPLPPPPPAKRSRRSIQPKTEVKQFPDPKEFTLSLNSLPQSLLLGNSLRIISDGLVSYFNSEGEMQLISLDQEENSDVEMYDYGGQSEEIDSEAEFEFQILPDPDYVEDPLNIQGYEYDGVTIKEEFP